MKKLLFCLSLFISTYVFAAPGNDNCSGAVVLPAVTGNYSATGGDLYQATQSNPGGTSCGNRYDVWYKFTVPAGSTFVNITVTLTSATTTLTTANTFIELFTSGTCTPSTNNGGCQDISATRRFTGLTAGATYLFRVYETVGAPSANAANWAFDVGVTSNDNCVTTTTITPGLTLDESVLGASSSGVVDCVSATPDDDVWYSFTAVYSYATITLSNIGSNFASSGTRMQLFSGSCGVPVSMACSSTNIINATTLTPGNTYRIRVYSAGSGQAGTNWGFRISITPSDPAAVSSGRMNEIYNQQILSAPQVLADPWEVTYGPDNNLWITESKGYRVYKMNPTTGKRDTVLDISQGSTFFSAPADQAFNVQANVISNGPQGGLAGLALHPNFLDGTGLNDYVYISYIHSFQSNTDPNGIFFTNRLVRFTYNTGTGRLQSPVSLCDTIPGSSDHNSQRLIITPVGGTNYLFYAAGDMGAGQFGNRLRVNKAQNPASYEGKILRFNLVSDGDAGLSAWIPNTNPYNIPLGVQSAVYCIGIRNNQGFAYDAALDILYGSSHGPFSDDEINVIQSGKNYGHPLVIGKNDGNANGTTAGSAPNMSGGSTSSCPVIANEATNATNIGASYKDPLFSAYPSSVAFPSLNTLWNTTNGANAQWPSEAWSGLDLYTGTAIPGWKKSLIAASLKWGRLVRLRLGAAGTTTAPNNTVNDTISYFGSVNRFRDIAFAPNGKDIYVIMDRSTTTSGPSALNPIVPACPGCLQKYTFLGYADAAGESTIPLSIDVADGTVNTCNTGTTVVIDDTNNSIWVPITGPDGNIMAEIYANGQNLDTVWSSFYKKSGGIRVKSGVHYLDRNITIKPKVGAASPIKIRFYLSKVEYDALDADPLSGISAIGNLKILKNTDVCLAAIATTTASITPSFAETHGANGYMLQGNISTLSSAGSSFYFANAPVFLPVELVYFKGSLQNNATYLDWETVNETNTSAFIVERSTDGSNFNGIGTVSARGNTNGTVQYPYIDNDVTKQSSLIIYYRLKMVDIDGSYKYSNIVTISLADITGAVTASPNPMTNEIKVTMLSAAEGQAQWKMTDNTGRVVLQNTTQLRKGNNSMVINVSKLAVGMYYLSVSGAGIDEKIKLQKL